MEQTYYVGVKLMDDLDRILEKAGSSLRKLDAKKEQTTKKIEYVTKYVEEWLRVGCLSSKVKVLNFVDGMSNAGIYRDGDLGTATMVFSLFLDAAKSNPTKSFNLVFNDLDTERIAIFKAVCEELCIQKCEAGAPPNLTLFYSQGDINDFISDLPQHDDVLVGYGNLTLFFIDPYDARTVDGTLLHDYLADRYCELFFNWFSSDHIRNPDADEIKKRFNGINIPAGRDAADFIAQYLAGPQKSYFSFPFRNSNNAEIYQIIFITPHKKGLEKIKEALWSTFSGKEYHRNSRTDYYQTSMLDFDEGKDFLKESYGSMVQGEIIGEFEERDYRYSEIELFVLRRSMLGSGDVIKHVIKPLVEQGFIIKNNKKGKQSYKNDTYRFVGKEK